jgi:hypothetical protein
LRFIFLFILTWKIFLIYFVILIEIFYIRNICIKIDERVFKNKIMELYDNNMLDELSNYDDDIIDYKELMDL